MLADDQMSIVSTEAVASVGSQSIGASTRWAEIGMDQKGLYSITQSCQECVNAPETWATLISQIGRSAVRVENDLLGF